MRTILMTGRVAATMELDGQRVASVVAGNGDTYEIRGAAWVRAGQRVRLVVERCLDAGDEVGEHESDQQVADAGSVVPMRRSR
jgi:hypothetical protein